MGSGGAALAGLLSLLAAGVLLAFGVGLFNSLVRARNQLRKAWSNIDVLLRQRHDEIPNLAEVVRGAAAHERAALEEIARLRGRYVGSSRVDLQACKLEYSIVSPK